eukprot:741136-Lingulodinium_polyedra.AAC.1
MERMDSNRRCQASRCQSMAPTHSNHRLRVTLGPFLWNAGCSLQRARTSSMWAVVPSGAMPRSLQSR